MSCEEITREASESLRSGRDGGALRSRSRVRRCAGQRIAARECTQIEPGTTDDDGPCADPFELPETTVSRAEPIREREHVARLHEAEQVARDTVELLGRRRARSDHQSA